MPLPQQVVEQLAREPVRTPGWSGRILMFSSTIFFVSLMFALGLRFGYAPYLESRIGDLVRREQQFDARIQLAQREAIINLHSQFKNLEKIFKNYAPASRVLEWIEERTLATVYYSKFEYDAGKKQVILTGIGKTAEDVASELEVFRSDRDAVEKTAFQSMTVGQKGGWQFAVGVTFREQFLHPGIQ